MPTAFTDFIAAIPKAELHLHIEGTLAPALRVALARRNGLPIPDVDPAADTQGYDYGSLEEFLDIYYRGMDVLRTERDFYDLTATFLRRCRDETAIYVELSFDPQPHLARGVAAEAFMAGILAAVDEPGGTGRRRQPHPVRQPRPAIGRGPAPVRYPAAVARPDRRLRTGSAERGNPPHKFAALFERARAEGYRLTAHCDVDQENSIGHIRECLDLLRLERIDHGVNAVEDPRVVETLIERDICLTVCPTWRPGDPGPRRLRRLRQLFDAGVRVTVNTGRSGPVRQRLPDRPAARRAAARRLQPRRDRQAHAQRLPGLVCDRCRKGRDDRPAGPLPRVRGAADRSIRYFPLESHRIAIGAMVPVAEAGGQRRPGL